MGEEHKVRIVVSRWLDDSEFSELREIARYLGRERGRSVFELDFAKIRRNHLCLEEVKQLMDEVGARFLSDKDELIFKRLMAEENTVTAKLTEGGVLLTSRRMLKPLLHSFADVVRYSKDLGGYLVPPFKYFKIKEVLESQGLLVRDETGVPASSELPLKLQFRGELRPYQREALDSWIKHGYSGILALPTGSGKTVIAIAALALLSERALIVTYTREQMFQWVDKILEFTNAPRDIVGTYYSDEKRIAPILVTTYQTAFRHIKRLAPLYTVLIIDEVHHLPADKFRHIAINAYATKRMGLSATVIREDGRHTELFPLMGGIVYHKAPHELSEEGYLAPFVIRQVYVSLTGEERRRLTELRKLYRQYSEGYTFQQILELARKGVERAQKALSIHSKIQQLVHKARNKVSAVRDIVAKEVERGSKVIVFTQYVDQALELGRVLGAPVLYGGLDPKSRKQILEGFKSNAYRVLVVTTVGDEGIDIPDVNVGVIVAGTGSRRQFVQRLGRLLRPADGKQAVLYEVVVRGTAEEVQAKRRKELSA